MTRAAVRSAAEPVAKIFGRVGLTPNALTLIGFAISVAGAALAARQSWLLAGIVVGLGAIFDLFDGALARATGKTSRLGAFLDSTFDRAGEAVVYMGIGWGVYAGGFHSVVELVMAAMAASFMVSYVRAKSESLGFTPGTGMANIGLAPREVRLVILTVGLIAAGLSTASMGVCPTGDECPQMWTRIIVGALGLITLLATITTIQRIYHVYRQSKTQEVND